MRPLGSMITHESIARARLIFKAHKLSSKSLPINKTPSGMIARKGISKPSISSTTDEAIRNNYAQIDAINDILQIMWQPTKPSKKTTEFAVERDVESLLHIPAKWMGPSPCDEDVKDITAFISKFSHLFTGNVKSKDPLDVKAEKACDKVLKAIVDVKKQPDRTSCLVRKSRASRHQSVRSAFMSEQWTKQPPLSWDCMMADPETKVVECSGDIKEMVRERRKSSIKELLYKTEEHQVLEDLKNSDKEALLDTLLTESEDWVKELIKCPTHYRRAKMWAKNMENNDTANSQFDVNHIPQPTYRCVEIIHHQKPPFNPDNDYNETHSDASRDIQIGEPRRESDQSTTTTTSSLFCNPNRRVKASQRQKGINLSLVGEKLLNVSKAKANLRASKAPVRASGNHQLAFSTAAAPITSMTRNVDPTRQPSVAKVRTYIRPTNRNKSPFNVRRSYSSTLRTGGTINSRK